MPDRLRDPAEANSNNQHALCSAFASELQPGPEVLRVSRLTRAGLPIALAAVIAPLAFGEARRV
jgi:hypothetical protein